MAWLLFSTKYIVCCWKGQSFNCDFPNPNSFWGPRSQPQFAMFWGIVTKYRLGLVTGSNVSESFPTKEKSKCLWKINGPITWNAGGWHLAATWMGEVWCQKLVLLSPNHFVIFQSNWWGIFFCGLRATFPIEMATSGPLTVPLENQAKHSLLPQT